MRFYKVGAGYGKNRGKKKQSCSGRVGGGGCLEPIFMETMDFNLGFGAGFKFLAPVLEAGEFFENRPHLDFGGGLRGEIDPKS